MQKVVRHCCIFFVVIVGIFFIELSDVPGQEDSFASIQNQLVEIIRKDKKVEAAVIMERLLLHLDEKMSIPGGYKELVIFFDFLTEHDCDDLLETLCKALYDQFIAQLEPGQKADIFCRLGKFRLEKGEYKEAETLLDDAYEIQTKLHGKNSLEAVRVLYELAILYDQRMGDIDYLKKENPAWQNMYSALPQNGTDPDTAIDLNDLLSHLPTKDTKEKIRQHYQTVLETYEKHYGPDHTILGNVLNRLAILYSDKEDYRQSMILYRRLLKIYEQAFGKNSETLLYPLFNTAIVCNEQQQYSEAGKLLDRAVSIIDSNNSDSLDIIFSIYDLRADVLQSRWGSKDEDIKTLPPYENILEDRRRAFKYFLKQDTLDLAEDCIISLLRSLKHEKKYMEIYEVMEQIRFYKLRQRLVLAGTDLLATLPADIATNFRTRQVSLHKEQRDLEREQVQLCQGGLVTRDKRVAYHENEGRLLAKRKEIVELDGRIRQTSPLWRKVEMQTERTVALEDVFANLNQSGTLVLQYMLAGSTTSRISDEYKPCNYLLVYGSGLSHPVLFTLTIDEATSQRINSIDPESDTVPGNLTLYLINRLIQNSKKTGLLDRLEKNDTSETTKELSNLLWTILVPSSVLRNKITDGHTWQRVLILPDGPLAKLSFEALVTDMNNPSRCYLLDNGPPISYSLFMSGNHSLKNKGDEKTDSILTVGDINYAPFEQLESLRQVQVTAPQPPGANEKALGKTDFRVMAGLGLFQPLPFSKSEVESIAELGSDRGLSVDKLLFEHATEKIFRENYSGKSIVHLACHGFADYSLNNAFGSLLLTPGQADDMTDDGFLTTMEIMNLNMQKTQVAILSACETNLGNITRDEGSMSIGRAFLIAGCRNVVTSNWSVDDESTAALVYGFLDHLLDSPEDPDPALALQKAKQSIRNSSQKPQWHTPKHWASFVLWGAD